MALGHDARRSRDLLSDVCFRWRTLDAMSGSVIDCLRFDSHFSLEPSFLVGELSQLEDLQANCSELLQYLSDACPDYSLSGTLGVRSWAVEVVCRCTFYRRRHDFSHGRIIGLPINRETYAAPERGSAAPRGVCQSAGRLEE